MGGSNETSVELQTEGSEVESAVTGWGSGNGEVGSVDVGDKAVFVFEREGAALPSAGKGELSLQLGKGWKAEVGEGRGGSLLKGRRCELMGEGSCSVIRVEDELI